MSSKVELKVPDLGDFSDVEVIEVLVAPGDSVAVEDGLVTLETDKAAMDVPASHAGTIVEVRVKAGDRVSTGDVVATVEAEDSADQSAQAPAEPPDTKAAEKEPEPERTASYDGSETRTMSADEIQAATTAGPYPISGSSQTQPVPI